MNFRFIFLLAGTGVLATASLFGQADFSADVANSWGGTRQALKIYVSNDRVRVEASPPAEHAVAILDLATRITRIVVADMAFVDSLLDPLTVEYF